MRWRMNIFLGVVLVLMFSSFGIANNSHPASEFWIGVDGTDFTLQDAFDGGLLKDVHIYAAPSSAINLGHSAVGILISRGDGEMTLLDALNDNSVKLYGGSLPYLGVASFSGHLATDVIFDSGKNLQEIINLGSICTAETCASLGIYGSNIDDGCGGTLDCGASPTYSWYTSGWSSNGACPTTTYTRSVYCKRGTDGVNVGTTCGIYAGCDCPKPATSKTTTCTWVKGSKVGCTGSAPNLNTRCYFGASCSSSGYSYRCTFAPKEGCDCGSVCSGWGQYRSTCTIIPV